MRLNFMMANFKNSFVTQIYSGQQVDIRLRYLKVGDYFSVVTDCKLSNNHKKPL